MQICARCKKRPAVIFITRMEKDKTINEGICIKCAKELGLKPVDDIMQKMGITDEDLETINSEMMSMMQQDEDEDDDDFECDGDCDECDEDCEGFYEAVCPHCGETVCFDETCDPRDLVCPACQEHFDCLDSPEGDEE